MRIMAKVDIFDADTGHVFVDGSVIAPSIEEEILFGRGYRFDFGFNLADRNELYENGRR